MGLPGLPAKVISAALADNITEAERAIAAAPGMYGRIWYGQGLAFDEAYQILQEPHRFYIRRPSYILTHYTVVDVVCMLLCNPTYEHRCPLCVPRIYYRRAFAHASVYHYAHPITLAQELSILDDPKDKKSGKTSGQNPNAGWYNRFVQTGKSDHETKTNGCFGGHSSSFTRHTHAFISCMPVRGRFICDCKCASSDV